MEDIIDTYFKKAAGNSVNELPERNLPLQEVLGSLPMGILIADEQLNVIFSNKQFCSLFNIPFGPDEIKEMHLRILIDKIPYGFITSSKIHHRIHELVQDKKPVYNEIIPLADGRNLSRDYIPVFKQEKFDHHLWIFNDVTEQIKTHQDIVGKKDLYENILDHLPAEIAVYSSDHKYLYINPSAISDDELRSWIIGKTDADYCSFKQKDASIAENRKKTYLKIVGTRKPIEWEEQFFNKDTGEQEYHLRNMSPVLDKNGDVSLIIGYGLNISERKKIEERIQLSEKRYRDLFNYSQALICTHDLNGNFLTVNPALCENIWYNENEIIGKNIKDILPSEDHKGLNEIYLPSIAAE